MQTRKRKAVIVDEDLRVSWQKAVEDLAKDERQLQLKRRLLVVKNKIRVVKMRLTQLDNHIKEEDLRRSHIFPGM